MKHYLTLDRVRQSCKPTDKQVIAGISNRLVESYTLEISQLARVVAQPFGYTWCPGIFKGSRTNANWKLQSVFALDFDSGITPKEVLDRLEELSIEPNIIYTTFSDTVEHRKFRVVFFFDEIIRDVTEANFIQLGLMSIFSQTVDRSTSDRARLFYGGQDVIYLNEVEMSLNHVRNVLEALEVKVETICVPYIRVPKVVEETLERKLKFCLQSTVKKVGNFNVGNKHNFALRYGSLCNLSGVPLFDAISYSMDNVCYSKHAEETIRDIYNRYSSQHNTMTINP